MTGSLRMRLWCRSQVALIRDRTIESRSLHRVLADYAEVLSNCWADLKGHPSSAY